MLDFAVCVPNSSVTQKRLPAIYAENDARRRNLQDTAEIEAFNTLPKVARDSSLQRYLTFFDRDDDSRVSLFDSFVAFHDLGFNTLFSFLIATSMHMAMSLPTSLATRGRIDPFLAIYFGTVVKALLLQLWGHTLFDAEGRFQEEVFERLFSESSKEEPDYLTLSEAYDFVKRRREPSSPIGWILVIAEWHVICLRQRNRLLSRTGLRQIYEGSVLWELRKQQRSHHRYWPDYHAISHPIEDLTNPAYWPPALQSAMDKTLAYIILALFAASFAVPLFAYTCIAGDPGKELKTILAVMTSSFCLTSWRFGNYLQAERQRLRS
ncbi:hypothetical protein DTO282F9_1309 [Paecilomyces variotii]|nr:hypothetical protein DTO282F9_1309 [Paecilomyces variotii]